MAQRVAAACRACSERSSGVWAAMRARVALAAFRRAAAALAGVLARPRAAAARLRSRLITLGSIAENPRVDKRSSVG